MDAVKQNPFFSSLRKATGFVKQNASTVSSFLGLVLCIIVFSITSKGRLWSAYNIETIFSSVTVPIIISLGALFVYSMGYMDVSVGQQLGVYCILMIAISNATKSLFLGFLVVVLIALACGIFNGVVAVWLKLPSIVTSLFIMFIFTGIQYLAIESTGSNRVVLDASIDISFWNQLWVQIISIIVVALVVGYLFLFTRLGKYTKAIGANELTTKQCGVHTTFWKSIAYMVLGVCIAIASLFMLAASREAGKGTGSGYAMDIMLCIILGGMPISGGVKSKLRAPILGAFTFILLSNGMTISGVPTNIVHIIKGSIFIAVVILTCRDKSQYLPR